jgi:hypothetical protein
LGTLGALAPMPSIYAQLLGPSWSTLAPPVQRIHAGGVVARGVFAVRRGAGLLARIIGAVLGLPPAGDATPITLEVEQRSDVERWCRRFGERLLVTSQWADRGLLVENMGLFQCWFRLRAESGALVFEQVRATIGFRRFALPLPRFLSPRVIGRADPGGAEAQVDVRIHAPIVGLLVSYEGAVTPEDTK